MSGPYSEEGYKLMGAAFEVYNEIGYGMVEELYQECLEIELQLQEIPFETKRHLSLRYKTQQLEKTYHSRLVCLFGDCGRTEIDQRIKLRT